MPSKIKLPEGVTLELLKENWQEASAMYQPAYRRAQMLDATDRGKLWKAIAAKFPKYQVLPDTNHVAYVKNNLLASLYSVGRSANLVATSEHDLEMVSHINIVLDHIWDTQQVPYYQMLAGERAALINMGITQVGWDNAIIKGTEEMFSKGAPTLKNIDPLKFMRDPYAVDLSAAAYCITWDEFHKNVILRNKNYENFSDYLQEHKNAAPQDMVKNMTDQQTGPSKNYFRVVTHWVQMKGKIHEIHTINNEHVLYVKEDIRPSMFPFAELYCNVPAGDVIGTSEPSKIFANSVAYNLVNSLVLTAEVKNQKPPKFVNSAAGINLRDFVLHGADSDYTFIVQGDASRAVHYHQFPQVSAQATGTLVTLAGDMQMVTGVDGRYTGKDTGSILTTGGMEQMLDQATLIDQPKIVNYEHYSIQLTKLILGNLRTFGSTRKYFLKDPKTKQYETITVNFDNLKDDTIFDYKLAISAHLPKNKQRISQMANVIMEKQMQYAGNGEQPVNLITPEEWLMMQDLPMQEMMLERMGIERSQDFVDKVSKTIFQYAEFLDAGMAPDDALLATADTMRNNTPNIIPGKEAVAPPNGIVEEPPMELPMDVGL